MEISKEVKTAILNNEIAQYENTLYLLGIRAKVNKKLGADESAMKQIADDMTKAEIALDVLRGELDVVNDKEI